MIFIMNNVLKSLILSVSIIGNVMAQTGSDLPAQQDMIPYRTIPDYPMNYSSATVVARIIDGLGFRFYWASEGLRAEDLAYRVSDDSRTAGETIDHILGLSGVILNGSLKTLNTGSNRDTTLSFEEKRILVLQNLMEASEIMKKDNGNDLSDFKVIFERGDRLSEYPYWNMLNGPIADAIYHTGQVVALRRASGNPVNPNISVLSGTVREP